jgi:chromosome segregation ATPase
MNRRLPILSLMLGLMPVSPVLAQTERSGGEAQRFMQQYQQISQEKTALQGQLAEAKKDLDSANAQIASLKKERDELKAHAGGSTAAVAQANASKDAAEKSVEQYKQRLAELVTKFREMATNMRDIEADRTQLHKTLDERDAAFDRCAENNQQLYDINRDILDRYDHVGPFTKVSTVEPFTRITRTRLDNLVVETQARAEALRLKKAATKDATPGTSH